MARFVGEIVLAPLAAASWLAFGGCCFAPVGEAPTAQDGGHARDGGAVPDASTTNDAGPNLDGGPIYCTIAGEAFASRATNPTDGRECCNPTKNPGGWTRWLIPGPSYLLGSGQSSGASGLVAADLDGDGWLDLAVADYNDNAVSILLQGVAGDFVPQADLRAGTNSNWVLARQLPGALPDLVVTNSGGRTVSVFVNQGGGTFAPQAAITTGIGPIQCALGSWTGGIAPDLVCLNLGDMNVALLQGLADGGFGPPTTFGPLVNQPWELTAADFRGKGVLDLAVTFDQDVGELAFLPADGKGSFGTATTYYGENTPYSVAAADCDGDGVIDLLVTHYNDDNVGFRKGNGDGTFADPVFFKVGVGPEGIAIADLNQDGWPDVIVAATGAGSTTGSVDVLWNQGAQGGWAPGGIGGFSAPSSFEAGNVPSRVIWADFNRDNAPDIATTHDGAVQVLLNGCP